jgi:hypothetical protein
MYGWRFLEVTEESVSERGVSKWHEGLLTNCIKLYREAVQPSPRVIAYLSDNPSPSKIHQLMATDALLIVPGSSDQARERMLATLIKEASIHPHSPVAFAIPGSAALTCIPAASVDVVVTDDSPVGDAEARRILVPGGARLRH